MAKCCACKFFVAVRRRRVCILQVRSLARKRAFMPWCRQFVKVVHVEFQVKCTDRWASASSSRGEFVYCYSLMRIAQSAYPPTRLRFPSRQFRCYVTADRGKTFAISPLSGIGFNTQCHAWLELPSKRPWRMGLSFWGSAPRTYRSKTCFRERAQTMASFCFRCCSTKNDSSASLYRLST